MAAMIICLFMVCSSSLLFHDTLVGERYVGGSLWVHHDECLDVQEVVFAHCHCRVGVARGQREVEAYLARLLQVFQPLCIDRHIDEGAG